MTKNEEGKGTKRLIEIKLLERYAKEGDSPLEGGGQGNQPKAKSILLLVDSNAGVEIITESPTDNYLPSTQIPLHLVNSADIDRQGSAPLEEASSISNSSSSSKNIQGQPPEARWQILPPIEVGLQLGHPATTVGSSTTTTIIEKEEKKAVVVDSEAQTAVVEAAHAEVQTLASEDDLARVVAAAVSNTVTTSSQTEKEEDTTTTTTTLAKNSKDQEVAEGAKPRPTVVTSETQTAEAEGASTYTQTLIDVSEGCTQTELEDADNEADEETLEGLTSGLPTNGGKPLTERPPTLPGSSVDLPHVEAHSEVDDRDLAYLRTRTVSPQNLKVQDDVIARVLLEHVGTVFPPFNPRSRCSAGVNYLDLSRLGDEGETPASDEIWLAVDGSGCQSEDDPNEDKFLTTDDTETYSINTDKFSTMAGNGGGETATLLQAPSSANLLSEQELADLGGCESFDAEAEATARLQGVLASELVPLQTIVQSTDKNVGSLTNKFGTMETVLTSLCTTIESLQGQIRPNTAGEDADGISIRRTSNAGQRITSPPNGNQCKHRCAFLSFWGF